MTAAGARPVAGIDPGLGGATCEPATASDPERLHDRGAGPRIREPISVRGLAGLRLAEDGSSHEALEDHRRVRLRCIRGGADEVGVDLVVLGALYVGLILALQAALAGLTGGGTLPVALSILAIAALFGPVRSRVRALVDRRFYRSRYDAQRTVEAFAARLRDQVELDAVGRTLTTAADEAVRPASVGVWIRGRTP